MSENIGDDLLRGVKAIARFIGVKPGRARYLIEQHLLPVAREGTHIIASKRIVTAHYLKMTSKAQGVVVVPIPKTVNWP